MKIIICGIGRVGLSIASYLSMQDNQVTIVDTDADLVKRVSDTYDIIGIAGHASQPDVLRRAGAEEADVIIAVTDSDEINMVACQVAHSVFDVRKRIARIRNKEYRDPAWSSLFSRQHMSIDVIISPEEEIADAIVKRMSIPGTTNDITLADNHIHISGLVIDKKNPVCGETLKDIYFAHKDMEFRIILIIRDNNILPFDDHTVLESGDEIYFICPRLILLPLLKHLGNKNDIYNGNIILCGGGAIGEALCLRLEKHTDLSKNGLVIIEHDIHRARALNTSNRNALILNGSALDYDILTEARADKSSVFVTVMNSNENNILAAMLAKKMGAQYCIALNTNKLYNQLLPDRFIDAIVNPETITVSRILYNLRRGHIRSIHTIRDTHVEIIEAEVTGECGITNIPLEDIALHRNISILSVYRPSTQQTILPNERTVIKAADVVTIMAANVTAREIEKLFSFSISLF